MKTIEIKIEKGQYLGEVLPIIETNTIINKTICGCGATTLELNAPRHSIIIEPNLPVILGKKAKHDFLLGVYEGVNTKQIEKYLYNYQNDGYYKIMTTPESFGKVRRAIRNVRMNLHKDFFLLFDECEKTTQDIGYRKTIILPIYDFFRCDNKAMVSATPIIIEDPRFEEQGFQLVKIIPTYDYRKDLTLVPTNNVYTTLRKYLKELPEDQIVCFFHNSTKGIDLIIGHLDIKKKSNVYCSSESRDTLIDKGYSNAFDRLNEVDEDVKLNKYNFFTSRFYSAVDIELPIKPVVIMITEVFSAPYSLIDPTTEAVQIAGRFRNGVSRLIHITNYNRKAKVCGRAEKEQLLNEQHKIYSIFRKLWLNTRTKGEVFILKQALERVDYSEFVLPSGERNFFRYNNAFREEYIKMIYKSCTRIFQEYEDSKAFNMDYQHCFFATTDKDRRIIDPPKSASQIELNKLALEQVRKLMHSKNEYDKEYLNQIAHTYKVVCNGVAELGFDGVANTGYKTKAIQDAIEQSILNKKMLSTGVKSAVYRAFKENTLYTRSEINDKLQAIFGRFDIPFKRSGCSYLIGNYFHIAEANTSQNRGWMLFSRRYEPMT
ncbi:MAG: hypothetical protein LBM20_05000 [Rikenellaceae bacterium]|jgi:hypothetical protein|nr:hypothetical protein [Rikenellaceae bacterium]